MDFVINDKITRKEDDPLYNHMTKEQIIQMDLEVQKSRMYANFGQNDEDWSKPEKFNELDQLNIQIAQQEPRKPIDYDQPLVHDKINVTKTYSKEDIKQSPFLHSQEQENNKFDHNGEPYQTIIDQFKDIVKQYIDILKSLERKSSNLGVKSIWKYAYDKQYREQHNQVIKQCFIKIIQNNFDKDTVALDEKDFYKFLKLYINQKSDYCGSSISLPPELQKNWYLLINGLNSATDGITFNDFIQFQTIVKCTADTFSEEKEFWKKFRLWSEKNVTYSQLDIEPYQLNIFDKQKFKNHLKSGWPFQHQKLYAPQTSQLIDMQILSHFEECYTHSQRFLRVMQRQVMKSQQTNEQIECHIMKLFLFNESKQQFELQFNSIYDISKGILDPSTNSFTNDCLMNFQNHTYYFRKEKNKDSQRGFQLYRHAMSEPTFFQGIQPKMEPEGEMKYNYFINVEELLQKKGLELDDLGIIFVQDVNRLKDFDAYNKHLIFNDSVLRNKFVCVYKRIKMNSPNAYTFAKIYFLKTAPKKSKGIYELKEPIVDTQKSVIQRLQTVFVWGENPQFGEMPRDGSKFNFTLKGSNITYDVTHEFRNLEEAQDIENIVQPIARLIKQRHKVVCHKFSDHMYNFVTRKILLPYSCQEVELLYYHSYDAYNIQMITPMLDLTYNPVAPGISNQQDEAAHTISELCNYNKQDLSKQSVVYEDQYFTFCDNSEFRTSVLYHIDDLHAGKDFDTYDVYFSNNNMIIKTNYRSSKIHVWHVDPKYINSTLLDKLKQTQDEKLFYQANIFKRFDRRNLKPTFYQNSYTRTYKDNEELCQAQETPVYIHKSKNKVTTGHNLISINEKDYECDENLLLIDLHERKDGQMSLIRLIHPDLKDMGIRLIRYFVCYSKEPKQAFFFFQQRNRQRGGGHRTEKTTTGAYFFVQKTLKDLKELANSSLNIEREQKALIKEDETEITILINTKEAYQIKYNSQFVTQQQNNEVYSFYTNIDIRFGLVQDMSQQETDFIIPFYFMSYRTMSERKRKKNLEHKHDLYVAFLDMTKFKWIKNNEKMNDPIKYVTFIKHNVYRYIHDNEKYDNKSAAIETQLQHAVAITFCQRVSSWSTNPLQKDNKMNKTISELSAKFIIGNFYDNFHDFQELLVTIDFKNNNKISMKYLGLYWMLRNKYDQSMFDWDIFNWIVPKVDNNGVFHGSYLMDLSRTTLSVPVRLKTYEEGYKDCFQTVSDDPSLKWQDYHYTIAGQHMELIQQDNEKVLYLRNYKDLRVNLPPKAIRDLTYDLYKDNEKYAQTDYKYDFTQFPDEYVSLHKCMDQNEMFITLFDDKKSNVKGLKQVENCDDQQTQFKFIAQEQNKYIIQTFEEEYLTINNIDTSIYVQADRKLAEIFELQKLKGGNWALKGSNDQYLEVQENKAGLWDKQLELKHIYEIEKYKPWAKSKYYNIQKSGFLADYSNQVSYVVVELNDDRQDEDPFMLLQTPFTQIGNKKFAQSGRYNYRAISILTAKLLKQVQQENIFDQNHQLVELYKANSSNLCMGLNNFHEVYKMGGDKNEQ